MMPQLPTSNAATSRASKPAPPAMTRGHGSRSRKTANRSGGGTLPARFHTKAATDCGGCRRAKWNASQPVHPKTVAGTEDRVKLFRTFGGRARPADRFRQRVFLCQLMHRGV